MKNLFSSLLLFILATGYAQEETTKGEFSGNVQADFRAFLDDKVASTQHAYYLSASAQPEYLKEWKGGDLSFKAVLFGRIDQHDNNRTHADIRQMYFQKLSGDWEFNVGLRKEFWGKTEAAHLVDIINQTDAVESFDGEQKLGQPMVKAKYLANFGTLDFYVMPYFRKRQFAGSKGRLRFADADDSQDQAFLIDGSQIQLESDLERWNPDVAFRYSHYVGVFDFGVSYFYGNGREILPVGGDDFDFNSSFGGVIADPTKELADLFYYPLIHQVGIDVQATTGSMLWKAESIYRYNKAQDFIALAIGGEYTFYDILHKRIDVGLLAEYLYDGRDDLAFSGQDNDVFVGSRIALNDKQSTDFLIGGIFDLDKSTKIFSVESTRRIGDSWKIEAEGRFFNIDKKDQLIAFLDPDSFLKFSLAKFF